MGDGGTEEFVVACGALLLELEEVQQLVLHFGEMVAHDAGGILVGDDLAEAVHFGQWEEDIIAQHGCTGDYIEPEKKGAHGGGEIAKMFQYGHEQKEREEETEGIENASYHPVLIVLADEAIETAEYGIFIFHGRETACKGTKNN